MIGTGAAAILGGAELLSSLIPYMMEWFKSKPQHEMVQYPQQGQQGAEGMQQGQQTSDLWHGSPAQIAHIPQFTSEQMPVLQYLLQQGQKGLQNLPGLKDQYAGWQPIENEAWRNYNTNVIPSLAARFGGLGYDKPTSGGFATALMRTAPALQSQLAAQKSIYGQNARVQNLAEQNQAYNQAMAMTKAGLTPQYQNFSMAAQPGMGQEVLGGLGRLGVAAGTEGIKLGAKAIASYYGVK